MKRREFNYSKSKMHRRLKKGEKRRLGDYKAWAYVSRHGFCAFERYVPGKHHPVQGIEDTWPTYRRRRRPKRKLPTIEQLKAMREKL